MGYWGYKPIENDTALDWLSEISTQNIAEKISGAFDNIATRNDFIDAPTASEAIAAADLVRLLQNSSKQNISEYPDSIQTIAEEMKAPGRGALSHLAIKGRIVLEKILNNSELKELWQDSKEYKGWRDSVTRLIEALSCDKRRNIL